MWVLKPARRILRSRNTLLHCMVSATPSTAIQDRDVNLERAIVQVLLGAPEAAVQLLKQSPCRLVLGAVCAVHVHLQRPA